MKILLRHCHLIIDDYKEYLDGALLINEEYIEEVYPHDDKANVADAKEIDVKGNIVMPDFFNLKKDVYILDPLNADALEKIKELPGETRILLGNTKAFAKDVNNFSYDGFYNLYENMTGFNHQELGLVNLAFNQKDKYVELDASKIENSVLKFTLDNLRKDRIILINDIENGVIKLKELGLSNTDILSFASLNAHRFYGDERLDGSLVKGKHSNIIVLNDDMKMLFKFNKGIIIYA